MMLDGLTPRVQKKYEPALKRLMTHWYLMESSAKATISSFLAVRDNTCRDMFLELLCPPVSKIKENKYDKMGKRLDELSKKRKKING